MTEFVKVRIPLIVTADGRWAASGSHTAVGDPDWDWLDEMCDHEKPTASPQRYWIETVVEAPAIKHIVGVVSPDDSRNRD